MGAALSLAYGAGNVKKAFKNVTGDDKKEVAPVKDTGPLEGEYSREGKRPSRRSKYSRGIKSETASTNKVQL